MSLESSVATPFGVTDCLWGWKDSWAQRLWLPLTGQGCLVIAHPLLALAPVAWHGGRDAEMVDLGSDGFRCPCGGEQRAGSSLGQLGSVALADEAV